MEKKDQQRIIVEVVDGGVAQRRTAGMVERTSREYLPAWREEGPHRGQLWVYWCTNREKLPVMMV